MLPLHIKNYKMVKIFFINRKKLLAISLHICYIMHVSKCGQIISVHMRRKTCIYFLYI